MLASCKAVAQFENVRCHQAVAFMIVLGSIMFALGCLIGLAGDIRFMVVTYRHGFGWLFTCLFLPLVGWIFFLFFTKESWKPVTLSLAGFVIAGIGYWLGGFQFLQ